MRDWILTQEIKIMNKVHRFFEEERGDTNFISILIILGIVIILAGVFMTFKDQIVEMVSGEMEDFELR